MTIVKNSRTKDIYCRKCKTVYLITPNEKQMRHGTPFMYEYPSEHPNISGYDICWLGPPTRKKKTNEEPCKHCLEYIHKHPNLEEPIDGYCEYYKNQIHEKSKMRARKSVFFQPPKTDPLDDKPITQIIKSSVKRLMKEL
jgi:hypothetical protein